MLDYKVKLTSTGFELAPDVSRYLQQFIKPTRQAIERVESYLVTLPQVEIPVEHKFASGMYVRTITIPKDTVMTGKVHLFEHLSIMLCGDMTVLTETGVRRITGHNVFISSPGTKRIGYAHEETVWLTAHATTETDVEVLENTLVEPWDIETAKIGAQQCQSLQQQ